MGVRVDDPEPLAQACGPPPLSRTPRISPPVSA